MIVALLWLLVGLLVAFAIYSYFIEPHRLRLTRRVVHIPGLPPQLQGLRIAHLSDLHVKSSHRPFPQDMARRAVQMVQEMNPDLICLTGDIGQGSRHLPVALPILKPLTKWPTFVVMGNHDHDKMMESEFSGRPDEWIGFDDWRRQMAETGLRVLHNEHADVPVSGGRLCVMGVGDPSCGWDDLTRAVSGNPGGDLRLMLVHSPDLLDDPRSDWADLMLCGHTHGGQLQLPGLGSPWAPVWRDRRRASGLFRVGDTLCHVTRGVCAGIRARFLCWPEVCELTLQPGEDSSVKRLPRFEGRIT